MKKSLSTSAVDHRPGEAGFVLPLAIIALLFGSLLVLPFLDFARLRFGDLEDLTLEEEAYFAADAGIEAVLSDLRQGEDVLSPSYTAPVATVNGFTPSIAVAPPPRDEYVSFGTVFADPGSSIGLDPLGPNADFLYVVKDVRPVAALQVSWIFTPPDNGWQLTVFEGEGATGPPVANAAKNQGPARISVDPEQITGGTYTIRFRNKSSNALTSAPFSPTGESDKTWLRVEAWKDYVITSTVGAVTITAFVRPSPGPDQGERAVHITTWHGPN